MQGPYLEEGKGGKRTSPFVEQRGLWKIALGTKIEKTRSKGEIGRKTSKEKLFPTGGEARLN